MKKGFSELFKESLNEYGEKFISVLKTFGFLYFIPLIILGLIGAISILIILKDILIFQNLNNTSYEEIINILFSNISFGETFILIILGILILGGFLVFNLLTTLTYIYLGFSKKPDFKESFAKARQDFWRYLGFVFVTGIFLSGLFLLLVIPGIIFMVYWTFAVFILINEKKGIIESLKKSFNMIKGRWWITFGYLLLLYLILSILSSILGFFPFGNFISQLIITPFMIFFIKNYYLEVRKNKK